MSLEEEVKKAMQSAIQHFKEELKSIRTSRANPAFLDNVIVEVYGTKLKIKEVASITVPESRQLLVTPFDPNNVSAIAKSIEAANLNVHPLVEGNVIRINIPPMDEATRKSIAKTCKEKAEKAKVTIREVRRKYNELVKKQKASGEISEDIMHRYEKVIQKDTEDFCKEVDCICSAKEKEVLEI